MFRCEGVAGRESSVQLVGEEGGHLVSIHEIQVALCVLCSRDTACCRCTGSLKQRWRWNLRTSASKHVSPQCRHCGPATRERARAASCWRQAGGWQCRISDQTIPKKCKHNEISSIISFDTAIMKPL